jgi:short-subunit dehydrogenase
MYNLQNKVVVVTGASSGIGQALALQLLEAGAMVAVCARNLAQLHSTFAGYNAQVLCIQTDVSKETDCQQLMGSVLGQWGRIDVLINNAGISMRALFEDLDLKVIREVMDVNFWGTVYCTKYAITEIRKTRGIVVGISSIAGYRGLPCRTGYSASKFAVQGFLEALRTELLPTGTHVMWVSPGFIASNIRNVARSADGTAQAETPLDEAKLMTAEECASRIIHAITCKKRTVVMTGQGMLTVWLNKLFPTLADRLVFNHFLKEPDAPMKKYIS